MATRIQRIENSLLNKVYVKSEKALKEMVDDGQLQKLSEYYTPDSDIEMPAMPVGSIFISAIPITDARVHLLDGLTIPQSGVYADFANLIKALHSAGNPITCTQAEFDEDIRLTGNCGKFVIDNDAGTIRLPKITTFIQGLTDLTNIGKRVEAGLPNITGDFKTRTNVVEETTGSFNLSSQSVTGDWSQANLTTAGYNLDKIDFNASNSNSIYGNSSTVQPPATQYPYYIVLASGYKSSQVVNIDNVMNEVNSKTTLLEAYPIGSIYMSTNSTSPAQRFGGTWERLKDRFLLGAGDNYTEIYKDNGDGTYSGVGGSADAVVVSHTHGFHSGGVALTMYSSGAETTGGFANGSYWGGVNKQTSGIASNGVSGTGKNMPPYLTVYMWQRVEDDDSGIELY